MLPNICEVKPEFQFQEGGSCTICRTKAVFKNLCKEHFMQDVETTVATTIEKYKLFNKEEKVFVAYSGGKDSTVLLSILHSLGYNTDAITVNASIGCYSKTNFENCVKLCDELGIKLHEISLRREFGYSLCSIKSLFEEQKINVSSCSICGVLRRYLLNKYGRSLGADKIALGHNLDDECQVILMNLMKGNPELLSRLGPVSGSVRHEAFIPRVKPLYFVEEEDIVAYSTLAQFPVHYGQCPCGVESFRYKIRQVLRSDFKKNIVTSFITFLPALKSEFEGGVIGECKQCGEPASKVQCKACNILEVMNDRCSVAEE